MTLETTLTRLRGSAAVLALALPLGLGSAVAQEAPDTDAAPVDDGAQIQQETTEDEDGDTTAPEDGTDGGADAAAPETAPQADEGAAAGDPGISPDMRVATVNDAEITGADVSAFLESLPPQARQQPPQMILSMAMQQLVLRELILQAAQEADLSEDEEVQSLLDEAPDATEEDAMIQVWLQREFDERIDDDAVQETYDEVEGQMEEGAELPPLEQVRPQIEQSLRQEALREISGELQQDAEIVFYDPDGEPVEMEGAMGGAPGSEQQGETGGSDGEADSPASDSQPDSETPEAGADDATTDESEEQPSEED